MTDRLKVGVVTSVHGIKGEVKVFPTTDDSRRFKKLKQVYLDTGKELLSLEIEGVKFFKQMVILKFKGYENPDDVMKFRQKELWIDRKDAVRLSKDEYFIADLIDMDVCDEEGKLIGTLKDVISTGANDVYAVETPEGKEVLFPAIKQCVLDVDTEARKMTVHVMEGLLDL
ncbi:ribosome maturation factor RimM [Clostridium sp. CAG:510]|mgnify:FL=1|jgi:16S rRNA processing protein RimM|nr:ribosome maturation factor RimM [Clostridium sp. CAG:510]